MTAFPFSAVVANHDAKTALVLAAIDPNIGGVLLRGEKGSAKTTVARGLAALLPGDAPFVELPLGATEDRVVGSLDLAAALTERDVRFQPGLLAAAHGGVLYVDEINLLADHLVDVLLDVAVSGVNRVERDNLSHEHPARFVLVGSMNPEEGDLRPQLLDRFGLAVDVHAPDDAEDRAEIVHRRLAFDADPAVFAEKWRSDEDALATQLARARPATVDAAIVDAACAVSLAADAEGMRADVVMVRAAAAHAAWHDRPATTLDDVRVVAPLVLAHRARRHPLDPAGPTPDRLQDLLDETLGPPAPDDAAADDDHDARGEGGADQHVDAPGAPRPVTLVQAPKQTQPAGSGRRSPVTTARGRTVGHRPPTSSAAPIAALPSLVTAAARHATDPTSAAGVTVEDLREPVRDARTGNLLVVTVDASGSMGADARMTAVKGALLGLLEDAYQRRDRVALVTFAGHYARVALRPTGSIELARQRLEQLPTGGETPLGAGIRVAADLATQSATPQLRPLLVLITDGRATGGDAALDDAMAAAASVARRRLASVVVDVEAPGPGALGLAHQLANQMAGRHLTLPQFTAPGLEHALRGLA